MEYNRNTGGIKDGGTALYLLEIRDHSIALYWLIVCCSWAGDITLGCLDLEAALGVRIYSLRKPCGHAFSGTSEGSCSGWLCVSCYCGRNNTLLLRGVRGCIGSVSDA